MAISISPLDTVTFIVTRTPPRVADRKTLQRLMRMQTGVQRGLQKLARRRRQQDNVVTSRGGRPWVNRAKTTKLTNVEPGETFTLTVTPQIIPDIKSVQAFLKAKAEK